MVLPCTVPDLGVLPCTIVDLMVPPCIEVSPMDLSYTMFEGDVVMESWSSHLD
jgi:hypothetical protein